LLQINTNGHIFSCKKNICTLQQQNHGQFERDKDDHMRLDKSSSEEKDEKERHLTNSRSSKEKHEKERHLTNSR
jgi:hypothetical protein